MRKLLQINPFVIFYKKYFHVFTLYHYFSIRVKMSCNIEDNRNFFLQLKSQLGLYHVVLITPKTSPEKLTLIVFERQQLPDIRKTDSKNETSCLKRTLRNGRRKFLHTSRLIQTSWKLSCTVTETVCTSKIMKLIWKWQKTSHFWQN